MDTLKEDSQVLERDLSLVAEKVKGSSHFPLNVWLKHVLWANGFVFMLQVAKLIEDVLKVPKSSYWCLISGLNKLVIVSHESSSQVVIVTLDRHTALIAFNIRRCHGKVPFLL